MRRTPPDSLILDSDFWILNSALIAPRLRGYIERTEGPKYDSLECNLWEQKSVIHYNNDGIDQL